MIPTRAALGTAAAVLVLSGCGVAAAVTARTTTVADVTPAKTVEISATPLRSLPRPAVVPATNGTPPASTPPKPAAAAPSTYLVVAADAGAGNTWLEILSHTGAHGRQDRDQPIAPVAGAAGPGGAYWSRERCEYVLTPAGRSAGSARCPPTRTVSLIRPDGTYVCIRHHRESGEQHGHQQDHRRGPREWLRGDDRRPHVRPEPSQPPTRRRTAGTTTSSTGRPRASRSRGYPPVAAAAGCSTCRCSPGTRRRSIRSPRW